MIEFTLTSGPVLFFFPPLLRPTSGGLLAPYPVYTSILFNQLKSEALGAARALVVKGVVVGSFGGAAFLW